MAEGGEQQRDDAYRAIGRYVVEFSHLIFYMRFMLATRLCDPQDGTALLELALGEATAVQIANAFFAVCQHAAQLGGIEKKIGRSLRAWALREIELRNNVAHGDWFIEGETALDGSRQLTGPSALMRVKPAAGDDPAMVQDVSASDLDEWSERLHNLALMILRLGEITLGRENAGTRVADVFAFKDKQVVWVIGP